MKCYIKVKKYTSELTRIFGCDQYWLKKKKISDQCFVYKTKLSTAHLSVYYLLDYTSKVEFGHHYWNINSWLWQSYDVIANRLKFSPNTNVIKFFRNHSFIYVRFSLINCLLTIFKTLIKMRVLLESDNIFKI